MQLINYTDATPREHLEMGGWCVDEPNI